MTGKSSGIVPTLQRTHDSQQMLFEDFEEVARSPSDHWLKKVCGIEWQLSHARDVTC